MYGRVARMTAIAVTTSAAFCYGIYWVFSPELFDLAIAVWLPVLTPLIIVPIIAYHQYSMMDTIERQNTELLLARAAAEEADRRKRTFLADVSHELRTPLNTIIGFADLIRSKSAGPISYDYIDYAQDISTSGQHLLRLIDDLLDISKIEAGRYELTIAPTKCVEVVQDAERLSRSELTAHNANLSVSYDNPDQTIRADQRALTQILVNLISNAAKYGGKNVTVSIRFDTNGMLTVSDNGEGMTEEELADAQELFRRGRHETSRKGSGLGLPLVRKLVELHGGTFALESRPAKGTTVRMTFPIQSA